MAIGRNAATALRIMRLFTPIEHGQSDKSGKHCEAGELTMRAGPEHQFVEASQCRKSIFVMSKDVPKVAGCGHEAADWIHALRRVIRPFVFCRLPVFAVDVAAEL